MAILVILYLNACAVTYVQVYTLFGQSVLLVSCRMERYHLKIQFTFQL